MEVGSIRRSHIHSFPIDTDPHIAIIIQDSIFHVAFVHLEVVHLYGAQFHLARFLIEDIQSVTIGTDEDMAFSVGMKLPNRLTFKSFGNSDKLPCHTIVNLQSSVLISHVHSVVGAIAQRLGSIHTAHHPHLSVAVHSHMLVAIDEPKTMFFVLDKLHSSIHGVELGVATQDIVTATVVFHLQYTAT